MVKIIQPTFSGKIAISTLLDTAKATFNLIEKWSKVKRKDVCEGGDEYSSFLFGWGDYAKEQQVKVDKDKEEEEAEKARQQQPLSSRLSCHQEVKHMQRE